MPKTKSNLAAEYVDPSTLVPWDQNPRDNKAAVSDVMGSIQEFGFSSPIVARLETRQIIAGHTRWLAAQELGLTMVPVRFLDISEESAMRLAIADNKIGELATWDDAKLTEVLETIQSEIEGYDFSILGFEESEINSLLTDWEDFDDDVSGEDSGSSEPVDDQQYVKIVVSVPVDVANDAAAALKSGLHDAGFDESTYKLQVK